MARQVGLITLKGKMGGISFYKTHDGFLARTKGGVNADRLKNDPAFERSRENVAEVSRAGSDGKLLRTALRSRLLNVADNRMSNRPTREMVRVIREDATNARGLRNVIDGETELLLGFEFNENARLGGTLNAPFTSAIDRAAGTTVVNIPAFIPGQIIAPPPGATHFKLVSQVAEVDFENGVFVINSQSTAEIPLDNVATAPTVMNNPVTAASTHPIFLLLGIEFYQQVNGAFYSLKNGAFNALSIIRVDSGS